MRHLKSLMARTGFAISLILCFALVTFGCSSENMGIQPDMNAASKLVSSRNLVSGLADVQLNAEAVPEGILVTFSNVNEILPEITDILIAFRDWGGSEEPDWENIEQSDSFNYIHDMREAYTMSVIEQVKLTGTVIFPFVQHGRTYFVTAIFVNEKRLVESTIIAKCIADGGIYLNGNINLDLNNARTGVELSNAPAFTSDIQFGLQKISYGIVVLTDDDWPAIAYSTNDLAWDFEPRFREHLKETGVANGDYPAYVFAYLHIIHDNISWWLDIAKTPVFTYSF